jgi:hypothetical protein
MRYQLIPFPMAKTQRRAGATGATDAATSREDSGTTIAFLAETMFSE